MRRRMALTASMAVLALIFGGVPAFADGSQTLGTPSVLVASGSGIVTGGTGLAATGSGTIEVTVPAGSSVAQVLLYWEGEYVQGSGLTDATATVGGNSVTGTLIGTSEFFPTAAGMIMSDTYRADITGLGLVGPGANSISVSGLEFGYITNGAGVIVILDDGATVATIDVRDGNDGAYAYFPEPRKSTVAQTFAFASSTEARVADIAMLVSSAADAFPGSATRPNLVAVSGGVTTTFYNPFGDLQGDHWDSKMLQVGIPAGATSLTIQVVSPDTGYQDGYGDRPASLFWNAAALSITNPPPPDDGCTRTQGYWQTHSTYGPAPYDSTWDAKQGGDAPFFGSSLTYIQTIQSSSKGGNAYFILAQQYIAAELNMISGAEVSAEVQTAMSSAASLLNEWSGTDNIPKKDADRAAAIALAGVLDAYNNGLTGPGHCD